MRKLELSLAFACCACDDPMTVMVHCSGQGWSDEREGAVAQVKIACPACGQVNQVYFEKGGQVRAVRPNYAPRPLPTPSLN